MSHVIRQERTWRNAILVILSLAATVDGGAPNIVFVLADDLGWNDVSFHGSKQFLTPNIDGLSQSGITLDRYYTVATCSPSRATILSGRSIIHHGIQIPFDSIDAASGLNLSYTLLPEHLQQAYNYSTAMIGELSPRILISSTQRI